MAMSVIMLANGESEVLLLQLVRSECEVISQLLLKLPLLAPVTVKVLLSIRRSLSLSDFLPVKEISWLLFVNDIEGLKLKLGPADAPSLGGDMTMSGILNDGLRDAPAAEEMGTAVLLLLPFLFCLLLGLGFLSSSI